jgi:hypothetical protein
VVALCACFIASQKDAEPTRKGRTVEDWLSSPEWATRKNYVELVILTEFGGETVPALKRILLRKGAKQELALLQNLPIVRKLYASRLTRSQLKERVLMSLESLETEGMQCIPEVITLAQNPAEPLLTRQIAIRFLGRIGGSTIQAALRPLQNDPGVGPDATLAVRAIQHRQQQHAETEWYARIRREIDRQDKNPDTHLSTRTSLWEKERPGLGLERQ